MTPVHAHELLYTSLGGSYRVAWQSPALRPDAAAAIVKHVRQFNFDTTNTRRIQSFRAAPGLWAITHSLVVDADPTFMDPAGRRVFLCHALVLGDEAFDAASRDPFSVLDAVAIVRTPADLRSAIASRAPVADLTPIRRPATARIDEHLILRLASAAATLKPLPAPGLILADTANRAEEILRPFFRLCPTATRRIASFDTCAARSPDTAAAFRLIACPRGAPDDAWRPLSEDRTSASPWMKWLHAALASRGARHVLASAASAALILDAAASSTPRAAGPASAELRASLLEALEPLFRSAFDNRIRAALNVDIPAVLLSQWWDSLPPPRKLKIACAGPTASRAADFAVRLFAATRRLPPRKALATWQDLSAASKHPLLAGLLDPRARSDPASLSAKQFDLALTVFDPASLVCGRHLNRLLAAPLTSSQLAAVLARAADAGLHARLAPAARRLPSINRRDAPRLATLVRSAPELWPADLNTWAARQPRELHSTMKSQLNTLVKTVSRWCRGEPVTCPVCLRSSRPGPSRRCPVPGCETVFSEEYVEHQREAPPLFTPLLGWPCVGKTTFLLSQTMALNKLASANLPGYIVPIPIGERSDGFLKLARKWESWDGAAPSKSAMMDDAERFGAQEPYQMVIGRLPRWGRRTLVMRDWAGEHMQNLKITNNTVKHFLAACRTYIALYPIDHLWNPRKYAKNASGDTPKGPVAVNEDTEIPVSLEDLVMTIGQTLGPAGRAHRRHLIIAINQADTLGPTAPDQLPADVQAYLRGELGGPDEDPIKQLFLDPASAALPRDNPAMQAYLERLAKVSDQLKQWLCNHPKAPGRSLLGLADQYNIAVKFCVVSAMSPRINPDTRATVRSSLPSRILDPLFLALESANALEN